MDRIRPDQVDRAHVYRFAVSLCRDRWVADDLAQEAILRAMHFNGTFVDRIELRKWLFRVTHNLWIDGIRKSAADTNHPLQLHDVVDHGELPEQILEINEQLETAFAEMQRLPATQRQVLHLRVVEGLSVDEVAETLSMTRGAVKTNLSLARKRMREMIPTNDEPCSARRDHEELL